MKPIFLILSLFLSCQLVISQSYVPFPTSNASWKSLVKYLEPQNKAGTSCTESEVKITGDSIIQGVKYKILNQINVYKEGIGNLRTVFCGRFIRRDTSVLGLLRDDTAQQKVYLRVDTTDYLVYDFSAQVGDTMRTYQINLKFLDLRQTYDYVVDSIYTDSIAGKQRRVFVVKKPYPLFPNHYSQFIEGIGSTGGLFRFNLDNIYRNSDYKRELVCFSEQGLGTYSPHAYPCALVTGLENQKKSEGLLKVFPNPTDEEITLQSNQEIVHIQLLSLKGKLISNLPIGKDNYKLNLPEQSGMYIVKVIYKDGTLEMRKILKQ